MSFKLPGTGDEIVTALKRASAADFSGYFDNAIDLKLPEKAEVKNLDKAQASVAIKNFFDANKIKGFNLISQREMAGTMYVAGKLNGAVNSYNITVMLKDNDTKPTVLTVRIN